MLERFYKIKICIWKAFIDNNSEYLFSDNKFSLLSTVILDLLLVWLTLEACCHQNSTVLNADAASQCMFKELTKQNNQLLIN